MTVQPPPRRGRLRIGLVVLLVLAAFFAALPWLTCATINTRLFGTSQALELCTWGLPLVDWGPGVFGLYVPGFTGPYWGNLVIGVVYLIAAIYAARTKRSL